MDAVANSILPIKTHQQAIQEALDNINEERSGRINGLYTRWEGINRAKMKYWKFRSVTLMAGMSGSGKSAILNMIEDDFTNPLMNPTFLLKKNVHTGDYLHDGKLIPDPKIILIAFKYEMDASDEVLRNLSGKVAKSYAYLLSSEKSPTVSALGSADYNRVSDEEYSIYQSELAKQINRPIVYIESAGNLNQLSNTVKNVHDSYPGRRMIITIDHTLLSIKLTEKDDLELMSATAKLAIFLKKTYNAMVIPLGQMNGEIEKLNRRENIDFHFPIKTDIHGANQVYWACDDVLIWHRPELLSIPKYGKVRMKIDGEQDYSVHSIDTNRLIHCHWIKSRKNRTGSIWFENLFEQGNMKQVREQDVRYIKDML